MAYNRKNMLQRMIDVQNIAFPLFKKGHTQKWVFYNHIEDKYRICIRTFYEYIYTDAEAELKKIKDAEKQQQKLF